ncbi:hypothetical protein CCR75_007373 [Bremia lactucae]|uniref:Uncharacterized protein n=1 Tax=Bremia lactucae TaxID=4779 RepID=A0A976FGD0_BRELC|nr:hypothetical protein CCR75_007373 [Bremia lactucae]
MDDDGSTSKTTTNMAVSEGTLISSSTEDVSGKDGLPVAVATTDVYRSTDANGSIITKTIRTTVRKVTNSRGATKCITEKKTTTVKEVLGGESSTTVETLTSEEMDDDGSTSKTTTNMAVSEGTLISSSTEDVSGKDGLPVAVATTDVYRSTDANGNIITKTIRTTIRKVTNPHGAVKYITEKKTTMKEVIGGGNSTSVDLVTKDVTTVMPNKRTQASYGNTISVHVSELNRNSGVNAAERTGKGSAWWNIKRRRLVKTWLPQFVSYVQRRGRSLSKAMPRKELLNFARDFCDLNFSSFENGFFSSGTYEEKHATWIIARSLSFHYPGVAVQQLGLGVGKFKRTLVIDEVCRSRNDESGASFVEMEFILSALQVVPKKCAYYEDVMILESGEVLFHGNGESLIVYFQELGFVCPSDVNMPNYLLNLNQQQQIQHQVTMIQGFNNQRQLRRSRMFCGIMNFSDDIMLITGGPGAGAPSRASTPIGSPVQSASTARLGTSSSPFQRRLKTGSFSRSPLKSPQRSPQRAAMASVSPQSSTMIKSLKISAYLAPGSKTSQAGGNTDFAAILEKKSTKLD